MLLRVRCKECGQVFKLRPEWAGRRGECPNAECRQPFRVPALPQNIAESEGGGADPEESDAARASQGVSVGSNKRLTDDEQTVPLVQKTPEQKGHRIIPPGRPSTSSSPRPPGNVSPARTAPSTLNDPNADRAPRPVVRNPVRDAPLVEASVDEMRQPGARPVRSAKSPSRDPFDDLLKETPNSSQQASFPIRSVRKKGKSSARRWPVWLWLGSGITLCLLLGFAVHHFVSGGGATGIAGQTVAEVQNPEIPYSEVQPLFQKFCFDCHSGDTAEEGFVIDGYKDLDAIRGDRRKWEKVLKRIKVGSMPPADVEQPTEQERAKLVDWLDRSLYYVDCDAHPDPGRVTIHRLNRTEYNNTIRDLVGVDFQPAANFPSDDVGYGFDNIGDVLTVPPLLIEKYLDAAEQVTSHAIMADDANRLTMRVAADKFRSHGAVHDAEDDSRVMASEGAVEATVTLPRQGTYLVRIEAAADQAGDELAKLEFQVDGKVIKTFDIAGQRKFAFVEHRLPLEGGKRVLTARFINDFYDEKAARGKQDRNLYVRMFEVHGPEGPPENVPNSHRQLIVEIPSKLLNVSTNDAATKSLKRFLPRAFRRPVSDAEVAQYVRFVQMTVDRGDTFERGMQIAVQAVLVSPQFLFRVEIDKRESSPNGRQSLSDYELASRLSYFLWSSMPDEELFELAAAGRLHEDSVLDDQVRRMLADPRASALVKNFSGQWLGLRKLATNEVEPDKALFPEFSDQLRNDMWEETERFFGGIVQENRSIVELIDGRYSYLNERLAKHYGVPDVKGDNFRRVEFQGGRRAGILTHGSILTLTSYPDRTSPVKRGEWVLANLLGDAPPDPPPVVPGLDVTQKNNPDLPLRKQLEIHRADPTCASCHKVMDEIGFGLEKFDAIGRWRDKEGKFEIDAVGVLPSGERFDGPVELVSVLVTRKAAFARCLSEKLLTYALGRGLEWYDRCAIDAIAQSLQEDEYRFAAAVRAIVKSEPFRMRSTIKNGE